MAQRDSRVRDAEIPDTMSDMGDDLGRTLDRFMSLILMHLTLEFDILDLGCVFSRPLLCLHAQATQRKFSNHRKSQ